MEDDKNNLWILSQAGIYKLIFNKNHLYTIHYYKLPNSVYDATETDTDIYFSGSKGRIWQYNKKNNKFDIPLYLASSSARCIVDIYFYLKHLAKQGDILIIDEPESHLTLKNQRLIAKLIASMINLGIKVFITTHSDFLVKELNNLILLSNQFNDKQHWLLKNKKNYSSSDFIKFDEVSVYQAINGKLDKLKVTNKGIEIPFFDDEINNLFSISSDLDYLID